jgi:23S rRNA pseudouridine2605 synthase
LKQPVRLQKFIADCGVASRRRAEQMIAAGRVAVNGRPVVEQGVKIVPGRDRVTVDGRPLKAPPEQKTTILLHKPAGYICTLDDPQGRRLVAELYADLRLRLFPVGRLDFNTSGLLLCTNDGELANLLMHPRYKIEKEYLVTVGGRLHQGHVERLLNGVQLEDGPARALKARITGNSRARSRLQLVIAEGRNRQVRRMLEAIGFRVTELVRTRYAFLNLRGVESGKWRRLNPAESAGLRRLAERGGE